jgi:hypothetical protein
MTKNLEMFCIKYLNNWLLCVYVTGSSTFNTLLCSFNSHWYSIGLQVYDKGKYGRSSQLHCIPQLSWNNVEILHRASNLPNVYMLKVAGKYSYRYFTMCFEITDAKSYGFLASLSATFQEMYVTNPALLRAYIVTSEICCLKKQFTVLYGLYRFCLHRVGDFFHTARQAVAHRIV